jgi:UDP-N-acetylglucosamine 4-epimerase
VETLSQTLRSQPRRWIVTGAAGFIGSNLLERLLSLDQEVVAADNFATGSRDNLNRVRAAVREDQWARCTFHEGDVSEIDFCRSLMAGGGTVLHQAALGSVPRSIKDPLSSHRANVDGFVNLLVAAHESGIKRLVYASSSSVYGDHPALPKVENAIGKQLSPYAVTKYVNEVYADIFALRYGLETVGLRYFNVFGPRQDPNGAYAAVIPRFMAAIASGTQALIYGDGETSRDFCYIENVVQINLRAGCCDNPEALNQVYNVAVGERLSLNELFALLAAAYTEQTGRAVLEPLHQDFREGDVRHSLADISKAEQLLGYAPTHRARSAIPEYVAWFLKNYRDA